ncbi:MAG TPA: hypothetical protein VF482_14910 [Trebonia sp.]
MTTTHIMTAAERKCLQAAARDLHARFRGIFSEESIHLLLLDSYQELAATATVTRWLAVSAERFARQRLEAITHAHDRRIACLELTGDFLLRPGDSYSLTLIQIITPRRKGAFRTLSALFTNRARRVAAS